VTRGGLLPLDEVVEFAERARSEGATRFCMGAAWREVHDGAAFDSVLSMVEEVAALGMEVCTTLGMLTADQARRLTPHSCAARPARSAAICAANGVDLREPLKPTWPAEAQAMTAPVGSVIDTIVLLNVLLMCACPWATFLRS
jgi:hypothetical protein